MKKKYDISGKSYICPQLIDVDIKLIKRITFEQDLEILVTIVLPH